MYIYIHWFSPYMCSSQHSEVGCCNIYPSARRIKLVQRTVTQETVWVVVARCMGLSWGNLCDIIWVNYNRGDVSKGNLLVLNYPTWDDQHYTYIYIHIWINYNDLTGLPNPGIMVNKGNHTQMALIQISELL